MHLIIRSEIALRIITSNETCLVVIIVPWDCAKEQIRLLTDFNMTLDTNTPFADSAYYFQHRFNCGPNIRTNNQINQYVLLDGAFAETLVVS
ncbi:unnamed protein product [Microthlaspi erraticum]|uniref:Uncharacterized protein n=1 Tax=Microthlaspi erraticum TaxID=1685480 RepID=A0A6D2JH08_9BRAS|nr:unnamed protein product [Microthlaspi erraticum]